MFDSDTFIHYFQDLKSIQKIFNNERKLDAEV